MSKNQSRNLLLYACLAGLLTIGWALLVNRGQMSSPEFLQVAEAYSQAYGHPIGAVDTQQPPGSYLIVAGLIRLGLPPMESAWIVSLVAFGILGACTFLSVAAVCDVWAGGLATCLLLAQPVLVWLGNRTTSDMLYFCSVLVAVVVVENFCRDSPRSGKGMRRLLAILAGALLSCPYWIKYFGIFICGLGVLRLLGMFWQRKDRWDEALLAFISMCACAAPVVCYQLAMVTSLRDDRLIHPGPAFFCLLVDALYVVATDWVPIVRCVVYGEFKILVACLAGLALIIIARPAFRQSRCSLPPVFLLSYLPAFCLIAARVQLDIIGSRYTSPLYAFIAILFVTCMWNCKTLFWQAEPDRHRVLLQAALCFLSLILAEDALRHFSFSYLKTCSVQLIYPATGFLVAALLMTLSGSIAQRMEILFARCFKKERIDVLPPSQKSFNAIRAASLAGFILTFYAGQSILSLTLRGSNNKMCRSPITVQFLLKEMPAGGSIIGNLPAQEIQIYSDKFRYSPVPWADPENGNLNINSGVLPFKRESALRQFLKKEVNYVVFCCGDQKSDPGIYKGVYGEYVPQLLDRQLPEVRRVVRLEDGIVVELADRQTIRSELVKLTGSKE